MSMELCEKLPFSKMWRAIITTIIPFSYNLDQSVRTAARHEIWLELVSSRLYMASIVESDAKRLLRFQVALTQFIARVAADRYVLAVVLVGSLSEDTIWRRESIALWVIEADGVTRRLRSDGNDERIYRIFVENGVNIHAEVIARSRFKQMVEGTSRTAYSCNFFATREIVYCTDASIDSWFKQANSVAVKDKERELLVFSTWTIYAQRQARKLLEERNDLQLAQQELLSAAHSLAYIEIIRAGKICEGIVIHEALKLDPELFRITYFDLLTKGKHRKTLNAALNAIDEYLNQHYKSQLKSLLAFLKKEDRVVPRVIAC